MRRLVDERKEYKLTMKDVEFKKLKFKKRKTPKDFHDSDYVIVTMESLYDYEDIIPYPRPEIPDEVLEEPWEDDE